MSSINSVRIPGLATGMDTDQMIKDMLTGEQSKIDKVFQQQQMVKWQQETYRDITKSVKGFYDKYFSSISKDYILGNKSFNTLTINSSNSGVITATGSSSANSINYKFKVSQLATPPSLGSSKAENGVTIKKDSKLSELGLPGETSFKINVGGEKDSKVITIDEKDTVDSLIKKINESYPGEIKASYSDMTGKFTIQSNTTGEKSELKIVNMEKDADDNFVESDPSKPNALGFLQLGLTDGQNAKVEVMDSNDNLIKNVEEAKNVFIIDGITYNVNGIGDATLTSTQDVTQVVDTMKGFIDDYNKIMDTVYDLVTQKKSNGYPPLTDAQKEEMTEEEIKNWEKKSKEGMLRNDNDLRAFMDEMKKAMSAPLEGMGMTLADIGITSDDDYNKQGQLKLDVEKFTKALQENGDLAEKLATGAFERVKTTMYNYAGTSTSRFAKKAGIEKTASAANNLYSEQIRKQEERIKILTNKMKTKEQQLYNKFARLEANMNRLNSQMSYFMQQ